MPENLIPISECFGPTIQGEGALIGKPTIFVRTGGCDYRCSWCDTLYAVLPENKSSWELLSCAEIMGRVEELSKGIPILVTISGGNPAMHSLEPLINLGHQKGYTFALETQGSIYKAWFNQLDYLTISPKPPSSGMITKWERLDKCLAETVIPGPAKIILKLVVFDEVDYNYARNVSTRYPDVPVYLQVGNHTPPQYGSFDEAGIIERFNWLIEKVTGDHWNRATVLPQLHVLLWQNKRGV